MTLVQYFSDGTLVFNWDQLPLNIREKLELRDKIFAELQERVKVNEHMTSKILLDLNKYAISRIQSELKGFRK
jgi:hypothetical protein